MYMDIVFLKLLSFLLYYYSILEIIHINMKVFHLFSLLFDIHYWYKFEIFFLFLPLSISLSLLFENKNTTEFVDTYRCASSLQQNQSLAVNKNVQYVLVISISISRLIHLYFDMHCWSPHLSCHHIYIYMTVYIWLYMTVPICTSRKQTSILFFSIW